MYELKLANPAAFEFETTIRLRQYLYDKPEDRISLRHWTLFGGDRSDCHTVACALGWAIRDPQFQIDGFSLNAVGNIVDQTGASANRAGERFRPNGFLYGSKLLGLTYRESEMIVFGFAGSSPLDDDFVEQHFGLGKKPAEPTALIEWGQKRYALLSDNQRSLVLYRLDRLIESAKTAAAAVV